MQSSAILTISGFDFAKAFAQCDQAPEPLVPIKMLQKSALFVSIFVATYKIVHWLFYYVKDLRCPALTA